LAIAVLAELIVDSLLNTY